MTRANELFLSGLIYIKINDLATYHYCVSRMLRLITVVCRKCAKLSTRLQEAFYK
jgi:hypothetical protein